MSEQKEFLVCVDSDGCAIDTMTVKHQRCFGPCLIKEWGLETWEGPILERWNEINLYSETRGINRFRGLLMMLREVDARYTPVAGLEDLEAWCARTPAFSEEALTAALDEAPDSAMLAKVLEWSRRVNKAIEALPKTEKHAFPQVLEALSTVSPRADIAVVSSANRGAVEEEWSRCGLMPFVTHFMTQDLGTKKECLLRLLKSGYTPDRVIMVGDALGDLDAAESAGVSFYPVLAGKEESSWQYFQAEAFPAFMAGKYRSALAPDLIRKFKENLGGAA